MKYLSGRVFKCREQCRRPVPDVVVGLRPNVPDAKRLSRLSSLKRLAEMITKRQAIFVALNKFLLAFESFQQPLLLQPIWKINGKEPKLAENCLDVFTWTEFALARMLYDVATSAKSDNAITRPQRALLRLARFLYEFSKAGKVYQQPIYDGMLYDEDDDLLSGVALRFDQRLEMCARYKRPIIRKKELRSIVLGGARTMLRPSYDWVGF